jgi:hypothetical protein
MSLLKTAEDHRPGDSAKQGRIICDALWRTAFTLACAYAPYAHSSSLAPRGYLLDHLGRRTCRIDPSHEPPFFLGYQFFGVLLAQMAG